MSSPYTNPQKKKFCPVCGDEFWSDTTVVAELCWECEQQKKFQEED